MFNTPLLVLLLGVAVWGQRPGFAGSKPIGYPELYDATSTTQANGLGNRFGEGDGTTQRLPLEANGDRELVDRLSKLPVDKQPFWFINWQALEEQRKKPQTYPQRPSPFNDQSQSGSINTVAGPTPDNNPVPLTGELADRNGVGDSKSASNPGYHYPDIFSPTKLENSNSDGSSYFFNGGALSSFSTTKRPQLPKRPTNIQFTVSQPNNNLPVVGNRNSNDQVVETSNSGSYSATNAFQNGNKVFSNFNSVVKTTDNLDPKGNKVVVQSSGVPGPDAPFQLTNQGVLVPNPAAINTAGMPNVPNAPTFDPTMFNQASGVPPNVYVTKHTSSSGSPVMNSSVVHSNAGFHNKNTVSKNATHYNSSYHNTYTYSYAFQNKYVIPHGGGQPIKVPVNTNPAFPVRNGELPNSNAQFVSPTLPNANRQYDQANPNNQQRVLVTSRSPPAKSIVSSPSRRQSNTEYSYYD